MDFQWIPLGKLQWWNQLPQLWRARSPSSEGVRNFRWTFWKALCLYFRFRYFLVLSTSTQKNIAGKRSLLPPEPEAQITAFIWGAFQNNVRNCTFLLKIRSSWTASRSTVLVAEIPKYMHILSQRKKIEVIRASYHDFRATYIRRNASGGKSQPQAQCPDELRSKNSYRQEGEFRKIENFVFAPDTSLLQDSVL